MGAAIVHNELLGWGLLLVRLAPLFGCLDGRLIRYYYNLPFLLYSDIPNAPHLGY